MSLIREKLVRRVRIEGPSTIGLPFPQHSLAIAVSYILPLYDHRWRTVDEKYWKVRAAILGIFSWIHGAKNSPLLQVGDSSVTVNFKVFLVSLWNYILIALIAFHRQDKSWKLEKCSHSRTDSSYNFWKRSILPCLTLSPKFHFSRISLKKLSWKF